MGIILHAQDDSDPAGTVKQSKGYACIRQSAEPSTPAVPTPSQGNGP